MKGDGLKQDASTSKQDLTLKPYGFCCNLKEDDPKLRPQKKISGPLFLSDKVINEGPDIKFRLQEDSAGKSRAHQRSGHRADPRTGYRGGKGGRGSRGSRGSRRGLPGRRRYLDDDLPEQEVMTCKRCRGPLRWYLEDEIKLARGIMMSERQERYHRETEKNISIAKENVKKRRRKKREEALAG